MLNKKQTLALALAAVMTLSLLAVSADLTEGEGGSPDGTQGTQNILIAPNTNAADPASSAQEDGQTEQTPAQEVPEGEAAAQEPAPDPEGTLSFVNLEKRVREGSLYYRMAEENAAFLEAYDFEKMKEDLRDGLNEIANMQRQAYTGGSQSSTGIPGLDQALQGMAAVSTASAVQALDAQYDALREQFDALKDGETQKEIADGIRQVRNEQDKIVKQAQSAYIMLLEGEAGDATLATNLAALDRGIEEMELRYQFGQVSAMQLQSLKTTRSSLASQQLSVQTSIKNGLMQMESLIGAEITGTTKLAPLPQVSREELDAMALEADLAAAKEASFDLYNAKKTLDDAEETFKDAGKEYNHNTKKYEYVQAQHTWQAAQYTYQATVQTFELAFHTLFAQVKDCQQLLDAARTALAMEQDNYAVDQLKYEQGTISKNTLLTAQDDLAAAQNAVATAERNLFSAYNDYRWAVDHGILN